MRLTHCPLDGKLIFRNRYWAERRAALLRRKTHERLQAYRCDAGHWHVGHS